MRNVRLPAEWEEQDGVLLAWPHAATDWAPYLAEVEPVFTAIARAVTRFERLLVVADGAKAVGRMLLEAGVPPARLRVEEVPSDDTWARDFGPITVLDGDTPLLLDFGFNGWGLKFASCRDNRISRRLQQAGAFLPPMRTPGLILEGGSIEADGRGTILTTAECLLEENRNPHLSRHELEERLRELLGAKRVLWLENGYLAGDDTDSHVDTLARLCPGDTIAYVRCDDPGDEHFPALAAMEQELIRLRTADGTAYRLVPLPWPSPRFDEEGTRLPATYANFLVINGAVLVPTYRDRRDPEALQAVASAFPGREVIGIDCLPLILQHGSLHCVTMQLPKGVLA